MPRRLFCVQAFANRLVLSLFLKEAIDVALCPDGRIPTGTPLFTVIFCCSLCCGLFFVKIHGICPLMDALLTSHILFSIVDLCILLHPIPWTQPLLCVCFKSNYVDFSFD